MWKYRTLLGGFCYIGISRETTKLFKCASRYNEALIALDYANDSQIRIRYISDIEYVGGISHNTILQSTTRLEELIKTNKIDEKTYFIDFICFNHIILTAFFEFFRKNFSAQKIDMFIIQLIAIVTKLVSAVADEKISNEFFSTLPLTVNLLINRSDNKIKNEMVKICPKIRFNYYQSTKIKFRNYLC